MVQPDSLLSSSTRQRHVKIRKSSGHGSAFLPDSSLPRTPAHPRRCLQIRPLVSLSLQFLARYLDAVRAISRVHIMRCALAQLDLTRYRTNDACHVCDHGGHLKTVPETIYAREAG